MNGPRFNFTFDFTLSIQIARREARELARLKGQDWATHPGSRRGHTRTTARR